MSRLLAGLLFAACLLIAGTVEASWWISLPPEPQIEWEC